MYRKLYLFVFLIVCSASLLAQTADNEIRRYMREGRGYLDRFMAAEAMQSYHQAVELAKADSNQVLYADALLGAGQATWYACNFQHAADTVKLAIATYPDGFFSIKVGALRILSNIYDDIGDYEKAFMAVQEAFAMVKGADQMNETLALIQMGKLYTTIRDYETALRYYKEVQQQMLREGSYPFRELNHCIGELYMAKGQLDSADHFYRLALIGNPGSRVIRLRLGEMHLMKNQTDSAFFYLDSLYRELRFDLHFRTAAMVGLGKIAAARGNQPLALSWAQQAYDIAEKKGIVKLRQDAAGLLASLYAKAGNVNKAYRYQQLYYQLKDSIYSDVYRGQLYTFRKRNEEAEKEVALKNLQAEKDAALAAVEADKKIAQRTQFIIGLLALLVIALIIFWYKQQQLRLKQKAAELEMQALRAQMNPHFIFNCLSAINHFVLNKETDKASDYLTRFSKLVRMVLVNAGREAISLEEELDMLRLYLDMEQLRFNDAFEYNIICGGDVRPGLLQVPGFILQPFCENAIWHGLLHKEGKGSLTIMLNLEDGQLIVRIRDNGIGKEQAAKFKTKTHKPMGQQMSASRLLLFNGNKSGKPDLTISDIKDAGGETAGTEVMVRIKARSMYD